jgi:hypothetical protein
MGLPCEIVLEAARQAGREIVENGTISDDIQESVSCDLLTREQFMVFMGTAIEKMTERLGMEDSS